MIYILIELLKLTRKVYSRKMLKRDENVSFSFVIYFEISQTFVYSLFS